MTRLDTKRHQWGKSQGRNRKWLADRECAEKRNPVEKRSFPNGFLKIEGDFSAVRMVRCLASGYSNFFCSRNHWSGSSSESFFAEWLMILRKMSSRYWRGLIPRLLQVWTNERRMPPAFPPCSLPKSRVDPGIFPPSPTQIRT